MDTSFPVIYVSLLLGLLSISAVFLFRQILKTRRVEKALNKLQSKLNKEKGTPVEYYELGSIYLNKKLYSQAISLFQKALKLEDLPEEESPPIYNALGYAYFAQEQYDLAIRQYKEALKIDPTYVTALNNIGHAYERKQLTTQALEAYEQALALDSNNTTAKRRSDSLRKRLVPSA
ncbi:tetratricopeptide repeat protein [Kovacikia minuta CCNUW1]|uniref:tetratricopeptide repeat protein n=1 Tax=Kovacikia minuta TaxID=2931930 RepID=UPI001CCEB6A6|nr:tetratricopeptide repeat protein [Kovacikia minuta]UBF25339.1 tetratricopeptide repeat protein [Kovacikia minuta CCNUW1]